MFVQMFVDIIHTVDQEHSGDDWWLEGPKDRMEAMNFLYQLGISAFVLI